MDVGWTSSSPPHSPTFKDLWERLDNKEHLDADVERDGHDRVEHDGVREEHEEGDDSGSAHRLIGDQRVPRQEGSEVLARHRLPNAAGCRAEQTHRQQEKHDL